MEEFKACVACGAGLAGPYQPEFTLSHPLSDAHGEGEPRQILAHAWICPACGLLHWYAQGQDLDVFAHEAVAGQAPGARPDTSYERRSQMVRMLRRVRRM